MDAFDRQRFSAVYRMLAEVLERDRSADRLQHHLSYALGDLTRRIFVGAKHLPPDELLEEVAELLRSGEPDQLRRMAERLHEHALHLDELSDDQAAE